MSGIIEDQDDEDSLSKAKGAGCEVLLLPDETGEGPGNWHFDQKYNEGRL
jgi:hypothetical protein